MKSKRVLPLFLCATSLAFLTGCDAPRFDPNTIMSETSLRDCIGLGHEHADAHCSGKSFEGTFFVVRSEQGESLLCARDPLRDKDGCLENTQLLLSGQRLPVGAKLTVAGVFTESEGFFSPIPAAQLARYAPAELDAYERELRAPRESTPPGKSPEQMRAEALAEWDEAITKNNNELLQELRSKAVSHERVNTPSYMADAFTMPDGSVVTCRTVTHSNAPPITSCDGIK